QQQETQKLATDKSQTSPAKNVFVSMPRRQQPVSQAAPDPHPVPVYEEKQAEKLYEPYAKDPTKVTAQLNEDRHQKYSDQEYRRKATGRKKTTFSGKDLVVAALIIAVIATGYYLISKPSIITKKAVPEVAKELPAATPAETKTEASQPNPVATENQEIASAPVNKVPKHQRPNEKKKSVIADAPSQVVSTQVHQEKVLKQETAPVIETKKEASSANEKAPQKKKKLGEVIKNIFAKNKKEPAKTADPTVMEEPHPATNRQSTRRSDDDVATKPAATPPVVNEEKKAEETAAPNLADYIDLSSNAPDSWMMGVTGLKITLRNRSNSTIQTAAVNVFYYDDNNRLLDKKMIYFSNVPPKGKLTLAAPDHKFADHVEFKVGAVSAKEDRYAKG
ncbi:MAG: FxLYD domain-containing protein, partial [Flavisolibacter sp.]